MDFVIQFGKIVYFRMNDQERKKWEEDNIRGAFRIMENLLDDAKHDRDYYKRRMEYFQQMIAEFEEREKKLLAENAELKQKLRQ